MSSSHGVKRAHPTVEQVAAREGADAPCILAYRALVARGMEARAQHLHTLPALRLTQEILEGSPEFNSFWNYRKEILAGLCARHAGAAGAEATVEDPPPDAETASPDLTALLAGELKLTQTLLLGNPKSYWIWSHRLWVLFAAGFPSPPLERELALVDQMLARDARNFHGWVRGCGCVAASSASGAWGERAGLFSKG